jgi:hypothetical protein
MWETVKKTISDPSFIYQLSISQTNESKNTATTNSNIAPSVHGHNVLSQSAQTNPIIDRLVMSETTINRLNYDCMSSLKTVKLACKVLTFDINFDLFAGYCYRFFYFKDFDLNFNIVSF